MANITVTWNNTNQRFEGANNATVQHNGTTWVLNWPDQSISNCTATLDGSNMLTSQSPTQADVTWSCGVTVTASAGGAGDPHINPIFGSPYTI